MSIYHCVCELPPHRRAIFQFSGVYVEGAHLQRQSEKGNTEKRL